MIDTKKLNITFSRGGTVIEAGRRAPPRCTSFPVRGWRARI